MIIDMSVADTDPAASKEDERALTPPPGWSGDAEAYLALMRKRFQRDPGWRQHMLVQAHWGSRPGNKVSIRGAFAKEARQILAGLARPDNKPMPR